MKFYQFHFEILYEQNGYYYHILKHNERSALGSEKEISGHTILNVYFKNDYYYGIPGCKYTIDKANLDYITADYDYKVGTITVQELYEQQAVLRL